LRWNTRGGESDATAQHQRRVVTHAIASNPHDGVNEMKIEDTQSPATEQDSSERSKLRFSKETLLNLTVKTNIRAGLRPPVGGTSNSASACCT
jgi:hypothetical protein